MSKIDNISVRQLYDFARYDFPVKNVGLLDLTTNQFQTTDYEYVWISLVPTIDNYIYMSFKNRRIFVDETAVTMNNVLVDVQNEIQNVLESNEYKYKTLYNTLNLEYDPISNYDSYERIGNTTQDTGSTTNLIGAKSVTTTDNLGERKTQLDDIIASKKITDDFDKGVEKTTTKNELGKNVVTTINNNGTTEEIHQVSPSDEPTKLYNKDKNTTDQIKDGKVTETTDPKSDTITTDTNARHDKTVSLSDGYTDTHKSTSELVKDVSTTESNSTADSNVVDLQTLFYQETTKKGNIGVTTSQQMIMSEREVANFNFVYIIAKDIVNAISSSVYFSI